MVEVSPELPGDEAAIREVHLRAFPTPVEADLVEQLRRDGDVAISLVAGEDGQIVGHVLFSRMSVEADGDLIRCLGLAPVAVSPERQRTGIGTALIEAGLAAARADGADIVFVLGEPEYYGRFGFDAKTARPFASPYAGMYFQAVTLRDDFRLPMSGQAVYAPAFAELK